MIEVKRIEKHHNNYALWMLVMIFALPVVFSWIFLFNPELLPEKKSNFGKLIQPPLTLPELSLVKPDGSEFRLVDLRGKWTFLVVIDTTCTDTCRQLLYQLRQIRLATGADRNHIEVLALYGGDPDREDLSFLTEIPGMLAAGFKDPDRDTIISALDKAGISDQQDFIIVDPLCNMVMRYSKDAPAGEILKDIHILLKATHFWLSKYQDGMNNV